MAARDQKDASVDGHSLILRETLAAMAPLIGEKRNIYCGYWIVSNNPEAFTGRQAAQNSLHAQDGQRTAKSARVNFDHGIWMRRHAVWA